MMNLPQRHHSGPSPIGFVTGRRPCTSMDRNDLPAPPSRYGRQDWDRYLSPGAGPGNEAGSRSRQGSRTPSCAPGRRGLGADTGGDRDLCLGHGYPSAVPDLDPAGLHATRFDIDLEGHART